jgi:transcriptional regulator
VVHAHGVLTVQDDERFVRGMVGRLTRRHEAAEPKPWKMADSSPDYIASMLRNIVGLEITLTSLVGKRKLSQNKEERDRLHAANMLEANGNAALAQSMRQAT